MSERRLLACLQNFETTGGVQTVISAESLKIRGKVPPKEEVTFCKRIHEIWGHGYEIEPGSKVLRTLWNQKDEPQALSSLECLVLDGHRLPLVRFCEDVCSHCFSTTHRTSGHARATARAARAAERREAGLAEAEAGRVTILESRDDWGGSESSLAETLTRTSELKARMNPRGAGGQHGRLPLAARTTLVPLLHDQHRSALSLAVAKGSVNARVNTDAIVAALGSAVTPEHRGRMASRGAHVLSALTALELSNGLSNTAYGSERFRDLVSNSALASTILNKRQVQETSSTFLEPPAGPRDQGFLGSPADFHAYASALLGRQHSDFDQDDYRVPHWQKP